MPLWKRNLFVCWFGMFIAGIGMSQIAPVLPLYVQKLGVDDADAVARYSGLAFGATFILSAVFSPIWGLAADRFGRKPMLLRASLGMAIVVGCMGFAPNVHALVGLRLLQGVITGYGTACTTLIATQTDEEHAGWALGLLSTSNITGSLLGPTVGGLLAETFGLPSVFWITGGLLLVSFLATLFFVKESFIRSKRRPASAREMWRRLPNKGLLLTLIATLFVVSAALYSIEPILTTYIAELSGHSRHLALVAGATFSAAGLANILAAPRLGKLSDRIGAHKVVTVAMLVAGLLFIPQAFVAHPWQLMGLRFAFGLAAAGLTPSVNVLIKKLTPPDLTGRVFGFSMTAAYLGVFGGAVLGGQAAALWGNPSVFLLTGALLLVTAALVYFQLYRRIH